MSSPTSAASARRTAHVPVWVVLLALALGGFAIGTTEFVSMGLLPDIADGVGVSVPTGGHLISAYALGVVVGAPLIAVFAARLPRRTLLVALAGLVLVGNGASALAPSFPTLLLARFVAGLPHGAYFGVASLVAASMVEPERRARAVGGVMLGLSVANVAGVPAATWLGQTFGWRSAYLAVMVLAALTAAALILWVPKMAASADDNPRRELTALRRPQVLLTLLVGTVGFGGMFAIYSYITPIMVHVAGLSAAAMPLVLAVYGVGMVVGNIVGARLVDHSVVGSIAGGLSAMLVICALFPTAAHSAIAATAALFAMAFALSMVAIGLQTRLMDVAGEAQTLAASMNHAALNLANASGALFGGMTISAGWGWTSPAWVGVGLSFGGLLVLAFTARVNATPGFGDAADVPSHEPEMAGSR